MHARGTGAEREGKRTPSRLCIVNVEPNAGLSLLRLDLMMFDLTNREIMI